MTSSVDQDGRRTRTRASRPRGRPRAGRVEAVAAIAGESLARVSRPGRLRQAGRSGSATLILHVAPGHAVLVQHDAPRLIERINAVFGYQVIERLKILADDTLVESPAQPPPRQLAPSDRVKLRARLRAVTDERLREALGRLGEQGLANGWKIGR